MKRTTIWLKIDQILKTRPGTNLVAGDYSRRCARGWSNTFPIRPCDEYSDRRKWTTEAGSQYVLFLWRSIPTSPEYEIIFHSGYQLKNGRVYPLDDVNSQYVAVRRREKERENANCFIFAGGRFCFLRYPPHSPVLNRARQHNLKVGRELALLGGSITTYPVLR